MSNSSCAVSRAHLTCDPGSSTSGFNSVIAVIKFATQADGDVFTKAFIDSTITPAADSPLTQRMIFFGGYMRWESMGSDWVPSDNISVRKEPLPEAEVEVVASGLLSEPVDLTKPCWSVAYLENVVIDVDRRISVCVLKYHHALADGFTVIHQMMSNVVPADDPSLPVRSLFPSTSQASRVPSGSILKSLWSMLKMRADKPSLYRSKDLRATTDSVSLVLTNGGGVTVSRLKELSAKLLAKTGNKFSINDILTCVVTMSLGEMKSAPEYVSSVIWVSLEKNYDSEIDPKKWDNSKLGFGYIELPLSYQRPMECLSLCHERLQALKSSMDPVVINGALRCIGCLPRRMGKCISSQTADKASVSMSNLVGPNTKIRWPLNSGWVVDSIHFATSPPFHFGPLISILSYDNTFCVSIAARSDMLAASDLRLMADEGFLRAVSALEAV